MKNWTYTMLMLPPIFYALWGVACVQYEVRTWLQPARHSVTAAVLPDLSKILLPTPIKSSAPWKQSLKMLY